jgi:hypothetical protein
LRPAVPDEHQPGAGEAYRPLKKLNQVCDLKGLVPCATRRDASQRT